MASTTKRLNDLGINPSAVTSAVQQSASEVSRHVRDAIEDAVEQGTSATHRLGKHLSGTTQYLADRGRDGAEYLGSCIRNHTLAAILVSLGAGLIMARLLSRR